MDENPQENPQENPMDIDSESDEPSASDSNAIPASLLESGVWECDLTRSGVSPLANNPWGSNFYPTTSFSPTPYLGLPFPPVYDFGIPSQKPAEDDLTSSGCYPIPAFFLKSGVWDLGPTRSGACPAIDFPPINFAPAPVLAPINHFGIPSEKPVEFCPYTCDVVCQSRAICTYKRAALNLDNAIQSECCLKNIPADLITNIKYYIVHPKRCGKKCDWDSNDRMFSRYNDKGLCTSKKFTCEHQFNEIQPAIESGDQGTNLLKKIPSDLIPQIESYMVAPYKCSVIGCEKLFYRASAFKAHNKKLHPKGWPFFCCGEEFLTEDEHKGHQFFTHSCVFPIAKLQ